MTPTPYDHSEYEYEELESLFASVRKDPGFISFDPQAHRAHLELYQRDYSLYFHNSRVEKWRKAIRAPMTRRRMWHVRTDAYLAHLVQNELVHLGNRDAYADILDFIRHQHRHLASCCESLLFDIYHGPRLKAEEESYLPDNLIAFEPLNETQF